MGNAVQLYRDLFARLDSKAFGIFLIESQVRLGRKFGNCRSRKA